MVKNSNKSKKFYRFLKESKLSKGGRRPSDDEIEILLQSPETAHYFDEIYGPGSAAKYLNNDLPSLTLLDNSADPDDPAACATEEEFLEYYGEENNPWYDEFLDGCGEYDGKCNGLKWIDYWGEYNGDIEDCQRDFLQCKANSVKKSRKKSSKKTKRKTTRNTSRSTVTEDTRSSHQTRNCSETLELWNRSQMKDKSSSRRQAGFITDNPTVIHESTGGASQTNPLFTLQWMVGEGNEEGWLGQQSARNCEKNRRRIYKKYWISKKIIDKIEGNNYIWIDQGHIGGCFFATLTNLCQLGNIPVPWNINELSYVDGFENVYIRDLQGEDDGYRSWTVALDLFCQISKRKTGADNIIPQLNYMFFKSNRGDRFNVKQFGEGLTNEQYAQSVLQFITGLLDDGYVIGVTFLNHFITLIGYNNDSLLFLGSYGQYWDEYGLHELKLIDTDGYESGITQLNFADALQDCIYVKVR